MKNIRVLKYSGEKEFFDEQKVIDSMLKSGLGKTAAFKVLDEIKPFIYDSISTKDLYRLVYQTIEKHAKEENIYLYRSREILAKIGSFEFEKFVKKILERQGFNCLYDQLVEGFCITHQVDIIVQKGESVFYLEVKHHKNHHRDTGLGEAGEIWARFEDMRKGFETQKNKFNFSNAWLFTNTKISEHARKYSDCKGINFTSWKRSSEGLNLNEMVNNLSLTEVKEIVKNISLENNSKKQRR